MAQTVGGSARRELRRIPPELLAALAVVVLAPAVVLIGLAVDLERFARFSLSIVGLGLAVGAPTGLALVWSIGASLAEVGVRDQTLAGYLSAASLLPFLLLLALYMRGGPRLTHPLTVWLLFVAVTAISSPLSPLPRGVLIQRLVGLFDYLGVALLVVGLRDRAKSTIAIATCAAIAAHGVLGIAQYVGRFDGFDAGDGAYRVAGAFGWSTTLGYLLALGLPLSFALTVGARGALRIGMAVCSALMAIGLALTFSRTSEVAALAGCVAVALGAGRLSGRALGGLVVGGLALITLATLAGVDLTTRFLYGNSILDFATLNGRTVAWEALGSQTVTWLGHGLFAARDLLDQLVSGAIAPHNVYLESLYDFGVVGAALLVLVHLALIAYLGRLGRAAGPERYLALGSLGAVCASLLHGLTGSELWHFSVGTYFFAIAFLPLNGAGWSDALPIQALGLRLATWTRRAT